MIVIPTQVARQLAALRAEDLRRELTGNLRWDHDHRKSTLPGRGSQCKGIRIST